MMKLPKKTFLISVSLTFLIGYAVSDMAYFVIHNLNYYDQFTRERTLLLINQIETANVLMKHQEIQPLIRTIQNASELHQLDFYLLRKGNEVIAGIGTPEDKIDPRTIYYEPGRMVVNPRFTYLTLKQDDIELTLGIRKRKSAYLLRLIRQDAGSLLFDIFVIVSMVSGIAFFFFKDLRTLIQAVQSRGRKKFAHLDSSTHEAKVMLDGMRSFESHVDRLQRERSLLKTHLNSALRTELGSGKTPPYQFRCTMVRTDINRYSTIYSGFPVEEFMNVINEFFTRSSQIIARYNGYVTDLVGDEIIYYFKDEDHQNSAAIALAAVRDINKLADKIHRTTSRNQGYPFTIKSAVACGNLRFGPQLTGFALSGGVFVETVRIISHVDEKDENTVYLPARLTERVREVCLTGEKKSVELKGIPGITQINRVIEFHTSHDAIAQLETKGATLYILFRGEDDVCRALDHLRLTSTESLQSLALPKLIHSLSTIRYPFSSQQVIASYQALLEELLHRVALAPTKANRGLLSFTLSVARELISRETYTPRLDQLFREALGFDDHRVIANALDSVIHFDPQSADGLLEKLIYHSDNRISANALIKIGMVDLKPDVILGLKKMLTATQSLRQASGIYALGELAAYYLIEDPLFLETHLEFQTLLKSMTGYAHHPDPAVRHQFNRAAEKIKIRTHSSENLPKAA